MIQVFLTHETRTGIIPLLYKVVGTDKWYMFAVCKDCHKEILTCGTAAPTCVGCKKTFHRVLRDDRTRFTRLDYGNCYKQESFVKWLGAWTGLDWRTIEVKTEWR